MRGLICTLLLFTTFRLFAGEPPKIVFLLGEYEYHSMKTVPVFAQNLEKKFHVNTVLLQRPQDPKNQTIPGLSALGSAELLVVYVRRMTLPGEELDKIKKYAASGKPIIGLRTASHAFENWKEWDREVLGGNYQNHRGNELKTTVSIIAEGKDHPILRGVTGFVSDGSLYKNTPLEPRAKPLLLGSVTGFPTEPVAWTHEYKGARVFYTSLGHPNDFNEPSFNRLLENSIEWALNKPLQKRSTP